MTWLSIVSLVAAYVALLVLVAYWLGGVLADARRTQSVPVPEPVRCICRRYAYPSPLCPLHGRKAA